MSFFIPATQSHIGKERERARALRQTQWWKRKLADGVCYHCHERFPRELLTMDHLIPVVRGGHSDRSNVVVSCKECNTKKGYRIAGEDRSSQSSPSRSATEPAS
jgi:5-methylcytosine-specific restriction protein A